MLPTNASRTLTKRALPCFSICLSVTATQLVVTVAAGAAAAVLKGGVLRRAVALIHVQCLHLLLDGPVMIIELLLVTL